QLRQRREGFLLDAGDLSALTGRDLLRVADLTIAHMRMDHFTGFDALLRVHVGRDKVLRVSGPPGICERVEHELQAYDWDLVERYDSDLLFDVCELGPDGPLASARFRFKRRFEREPLSVAD